MYPNQGPLSGILSSFNYVETALLVLAVDMPMVKEGTIERIVNQRDTSKPVTAFFDKEKQLWQGTLAIWEYSSYPLLQTYFDNGGRSIQKFLFQIDAKRVAIENQLDFMNVNTQKDFEQLKNGR